MHNNESIEYNVILMMKMTQVIVFCWEFIFQEKQQKSINPKIMDGHGEKSHMK